MKSFSTVSVSGGIKLQFNTLGKLQYTLQITGSFLRLSIYLEANPRAQLIYTSISNESVMN